jgi:hypothetical protein
MGNGVSGRCEHRTARRRQRRVSFVFAGEKTVAQTRAGKQVLTPGDGAVARICAGAPVGQLLIVETVGLTRAICHVSAGSPRRSAPQSRRIAQRKRRPTSNVDAMMVSREARQDLLERRDFPGWAKAGYFVSFPGDVRGA